MIYEFGEFHLDLKRKCLWRNGQIVSIQPKVFDILAVFVEKHGEIVTQEELMKVVWADTFVEESNLRFCIHSLRKTLGKNAKSEDYVETIPKRGYRFTAEFHEKSTEILLEKTNEVPAVDPLPIIEKPQPARRNWLIGIVILSLVSLLILAFIWGKNEVPKPKSALGLNQIAVLPFETIGEKEQAMQIGLTDTLITNLTRIKGLKILPMASVRRFAGQNFDALQVGKELGTDAVLSGNYRLDGENLRVTINLLWVADGSAIWTETFTAKGKSGFELENAVALRMARLFSLKVADAEDEQLLKNQKLNTEAVQNYLSARKIWRKGELFRRKEMMGLFEKTIQLEPNWALAYAGYAEALVTSDQLLVEWDKAEGIANKALELDKSLAQPHAVLGEVYQWRDWDWEKAENEFKQATALNPNEALSYFKYSQFLRLQRRFAEAETELKKAVEIEPFSPLFQISFCELYYFERKFDQALSACNFAKQIEPNFWRTPKLLYWIYVEKKLYSELGELILDKLTPTEKANHPLAKALAKNDLRPFFQYLLNEPSRSGGEKPITKAMLYCQLGEKEKSIELLETALAQRDGNLPAANADSIFDSIRTDKRFEEVMRKVGLRK